MQGNTIKMLSNSARISLRSENASLHVGNTPRSSRRLEVVSKQATKVTAISTKLEWRIDQFEKLMKLFKNGHNLISKQFSCPQASSVIWELHVYPNGKREEDNNNVSFFLRQVGLQRGEDPIMTEFQIYTLDANNCRISVCRDTKDFSNQQGRGKFQVHRDKMLAALRSDGSLMLICEVEYLPPGSKISVEQEDDTEVSDEMTNKTEFSVRDSLREMFESELFADCTIQCGTKSFHAHRCILGQHSPVFRSMFAQKSMIEAQNGIIQITDSRPEAVRAMLEYIYTGSISSGMVENFAQSILAIADKYAVFPLKEYCEKYLSSTICKKNVASMAVIADMYFASFLKKACTRFISTHHKIIIRSPEWKELKNARSELANELLESVLNDHSSADSCAEIDDVIEGISGQNCGLTSIPNSNILLGNYNNNSSSVYIYESSSLLGNNNISNLSNINYSKPGNKIFSSGSIFTSGSNVNQNNYINSSQTSTSSLASTNSTSINLKNNNNSSGVFLNSNSQQSHQESTGIDGTTDEQIPPIRKRLRRSGITLLNGGTVTHRLNTTNNTSSSISYANNIGTNSSSS